MFTPDGRVREEFAAEAESSPAPLPPPSPPDRDVEIPASAPVFAPENAGAAGPPPALEGSGARLELPGSPAGLGPGFLDLVELLAQPVPFYLGDAALPDGQSVENLEMARLHIDMLDVLRQRTAGNLTADESAVLEDLLYQLRVRYVQKRG
jgi:hypothetical protein